LMCISSSNSFRVIMKFFHETISLFGPSCRIGFVEKFVTAPIMVID